MTKPSRWICTSQPTRPTATTTICGNSAAASSCAKEQRASRIVQNNSIGTRATTACIPIPICTLSRPTATCKATGLRPTTNYPTITSNKHAAICLCHKTKVPPCQNLALLAVLTVLALLAVLPQQWSPQIQSADIPARADNFSFCQPLSWAYTPRNQYFFGKNYPYSFFFYNFARCFGAYPLPQGRLPRPHLRTYRPVKLWSNANKRWPYQSNPYLIIYKAWTLATNSQANNNKNNNN